MREVGFITALQKQNWLQLAAILQLAMILLECIRIGLAVAWMGDTPESPWKTSLMHITVALPCSAEHLVCPELLLPFLPCNSHMEDFFIQMY